MAYFGDTIAHASLLGVAIGLMLNLNYSLAIVPVCLLLAFLITFFQNKQLPTDTTLGIFAHGSLAIGLLLVSIIPDQRVSMQALLIGDLLSINYHDITVLGLVTAGIMTLIILNWKALVFSSISSELAEVEGAHRLLELMLTAMIALSIAFGIQYVGVLLMSAMLIIPAATARAFSSSPEAMAILASILCLIAAFSGLLGSAFLDLAAGPAIVSTAVLLFIFARIKSARSKIKLSSA